MKSSYTRLSQHINAFFWGIILLSSLVSSRSMAQSLTIQTPNGGEVWTYGGVEIATWTGQNLSSVMNIEFSYDGGNNWWYLGQVPSAPNGGSASISVPNVATTNAKLRISDFAFPAATDVSNAAFTVVIPSIWIWEPSGNSAVFANSLAQVYWILNVPGITLLNAEISIDNGQTFTPVAQNINAQTSYTYLELSDTPSDSCILKLYNPQNPSQYGLSEVFTISNLPLYTLTSPAGGEIVNTLSPFTISWTVENPYSPYNYLEYSTDNGQSWTVIDNGVSAGLSGSYEWITPNTESEECLIRITDSYALSSSDTSAAFTILTFPETPVCMVTVDNLTNNNVIIWEKPVSEIISDFLVYKETDQANVYAVIDTVSYEDVPMVTDDDSNPAMRPYRYKIGFRDSDNRVYPTSDYHQTIHLTISQGVNSNWNLIWTPYIGFNYSSYSIMRKVGSGSFEQIATVSSSFTSFTDFNAPPGEVAYMVSIINPEGCDVGSLDNPYNVVYSNEASLGLVSLAENKDINFSIFPVPAKDKVNIQFGSNIEEVVSLTITDLTGRNVYSETLGNVRPGQMHSINSSGFAEGLYLLHVNSAGMKTSKKIVVQN